MQPELLETPRGRVNIWTRGPEDGPLLVVVRGAFAELTDLEWLDTGQAQVAFLHLPGFHTPRFTDVSIAAFTEGLSAAVASRFPGRSYVAVGISAGALVALGLPGAKAVLAIEPFFRTAHLWPLIEFLGFPGAAAGASWAEAIFGHTSGGRDYRELLTGLSAPAIAMVGTEPLLPYRRLTRMPSLSDDLDRAALKRHPLVELREFVGGHDPAREDKASVNAALAKILPKTT